MPTLRTISLTRFKTDPQRIITPGIPAVSGRPAMKRIVICLTLLLIAAFSNPVQADNAKSLSRDTLGSTGRQFRDTIKELQEEYAEFTQVTQALKDAGASYQQALTADAADLSAYATARKQAAMSGVLAFDAGYAALFLQKKKAARFMDASRSLSEKAGLVMPFSPAMKKLLKDPGAIEDFDLWSDAVDETLAAFLTDGLGSDREVQLLTDFFYGMVMEGLYITGESAAVAGYSPEMLALMDRERERIAFMIKVLNLLRGDQTFAQGTQMHGRMYLLKEAYAWLTVAEFTPATVDELRQIIKAEREALLESRDTPQMTAPPAE